MAEIPSSAVANESALIPSTLEQVWGTIRDLDKITWWKIVDSVTPSEGADASKVGSSFVVKFQDETEWTVSLVELSDIDHRVVFDVIASEPPLKCTSMLHTLSLKKVTLSDQVFMEWRTNFSSDAGQDVIQDSQFKKLEAMQGLISTCSKTACCKCCDPCSCNPCACGVDSSAKKEKTAACKCGDNCTCDPCACGADGGPAKKQKTCCS
eukprot:CAMPEP_0113944278 /NCGR_PEP_ID=MMETSP1339-20121228/32572_1 /TAXON_ID=94617 /ORGANISM="Fibrocapsa japonica" /LENGTH=208 /DNA_ID=CAMNT_0000949425 /DNA_START=93 /DNA_END=719 /DNA_ORIENTATION=+ /assembly_acc=CAM_ASM_000762